MSFQIEYIRYNLRPLFRISSHFLFVKGYSKHDSIKCIHNNVVLFIKKTNKQKTNIKQKSKNNSIFHDLRIIITNF